MYAALFDSESGLPTPALLYDRLVIALARTQRTGTAVAVMHFSTPKTCDTRAVIAAARRVGTELRADDTVGRVSPHQFVALCHVRDAQEVPVVVRRIADAFEHAQADFSLAVRRAVSGPDSRARDLLRQAQQAPEVLLSDARKSTMTQVIASRLWPPAVATPPLR